MSLWVRSQNKENLMDIDVVEISEYGISKPKAYNIESHCYVLGTYSSKEKALKVLDMIVNYINSGGRMFVTDQHKTDFGMSAVYEKKLGVFQIPKDDEVEE